MPVKKQLMELIYQVQDEVRDCFTFKVSFVGSSNTKRNLITRNRKSNKGFDFDVNLHVNDDEEKFTAKEIRDKIREALNKYGWKYGYGYCEDETRVLTIKNKNIYTCSVNYSCDFAIVYDLKDGRQQYIHHNKVQRTYSWKFLPTSEYELNERMEQIKKWGKWQELRDLYINKKNSNTVDTKKSRSILAETVNDIYVNYKSRLGDF